MLNDKHPCTLVSSISRKPLIVLEETSAEYSQALWNSWQLRRHHTRALWWKHLLCCWKRTNIRLVSCRDRSQAGLCHVRFSLQYHYRLGNEEHHQCKERPEVEPHLGLRGPRLCRWHSPSHQPAQRSLREVQLPPSGLKVYRTLHQHHQDKGAMNKRQGHWHNFHWWLRSWRRQLLHLPRCHSPWSCWVTWRHLMQAVNRKKSICPSKSCLEV